MKKLIILICFIATFGCKNDQAQVDGNTIDAKSIVLKYATGFSVVQKEDFKIIEVKNPWPNSDATFSYIQSPTDELASSIGHEDHAGVIPMDIKSLVVTSTTHVPALELLGVTSTLVGFPGCDYISSEQTRKRIDAGHVRELGKNEGINTEVLLELKPDLVIGFGVDGTNKTFENIKKAGIPVIYNGDWVESSALAKAEWIKFFGVLFNKEKEADSIFNKIEQDYLKAKEIALRAKRSPSVLSGAMHKDIWYLPNGTSPEAQFLLDANINYLWKDTAGKGSLALSFETVFEKAKDADIWLSPSYYSSLEQLEKANSHYSKFEAFKNKKVYTFSNTTGPTGGVLYYELGIARPDLVLKDIIKICHPDLLQDYEPFFFKPLQ
ncbi:MAG: ABC transporter substrate-binding protein [Flavobacteriaceae bacterium]|nr:ABC transporter substrate-binding protein [Flavobacteriaceae bacterium]